MSDLRCTGCTLSLPYAAFGPSSRGGYARMCRDCIHARAYKRKHGMTIYEREFQVVMQDGCAICGVEEPTEKGWIVDHDHLCCPGNRSCPSCRRGIICARCNAVLGYALDDPETLRRAADYLELGTRLSESDCQSESDSDILRGVRK